MKETEKERYYSVPDKERQNNSFLISYKHGKYPKKKLSRQTIKKIKDLLVSSCTDAYKHTYTVLVLRVEEDAVKISCYNEWVDSRFIKGVKIYDKENYTIE